MATKETTMQAEKLEAAHPALLLDKRGVTIVGITPQLEWKDIITVANDKFDPTVKGTDLNAIRFTVRGGLKFCVRKEDIVWAENKEIVDTEDIRPLPKCTDETCIQYGRGLEFESLYGKSLVVASNNLRWAISFGEALRGKGLALRICEESLIYEIAARLNGEDEDGKADFVPWLKPLERQMRLIMKDGLASKKDATEIENKAIVAAFLSVASAFDRTAGDDKFNLERGLGSYDNKSAEYKKLRGAADRKEAEFMRRAYDAFRNACAWSGDWEHEGKEEFEGQLEYIMGSAEFPTTVIACSDLPTDFSLLVGIGIPDATIMSKHDIAYYDKLKFPEGHPKEGEIYVQDAKDKDVYTVLTTKNTGALTKEGAKDVLAKLKKVLPKAQ